jgi:hypothetical protein
MMIIKIEHQSQLASDLSGHILSWKAISKLGTLWVFINLEFDFHFLWKRPLEFDHFEKKRPLEFTVH